MTRSTKQRLLDAAEELFTSRGLDVPVRDIVAAAGANVAAVNYHFGSREGLVTAVLRHKWAAMAKCRAEALRSLLERSPSPEVREVIAAHVAATVAFCEQEGDGAERWLEVTGDLWLTRHPAITGDGVTGEPVDDLWEELLRAALPHLPDDLFRARLGFAMDLLITGRRVSLPPMFRPGPTLDDVRHREALIDFVTAGLASPP